MVPIPASRIPLSLAGIILGQCDTQEVRSLPSFVVSTNQILGNLSISTYAQSPSYPLS
jgi:hypothetical protein